MLLICPEKNTYTWPQAPAKIRPFPSCPRGDSGDKGKSKRAGKKTRPFRLSLAPTICPWVCEDVLKRKVRCKAIDGLWTAFLFGERVKKSGEGKEWEPVDKHFFEVIYGGSNGRNCLRAKISENKGRINMNSCPVKVTLKVKNLILIYTCYQ